MNDQGSKLESIDKIFNPDSVAIIGASSNVEKIGYKLLKNIIDASFKGDFTIKCFRSFTGMFGHSRNWRREICLLFLNFSFAMSLLELMVVRTLYKIFPVSLSEWPRII